MKSELEALLSNAVISVPTKGVTEIRQFITDHSQELTPAELTKITLLGDITSDIDLPLKYNPEKRDKIEESLRNILELSRKQS